MKENRLNAGFGRAMISPYRWDGEKNDWALDAEGRRILVYEPLGGFGNDTGRLCRGGRAEGTAAAVYDKDLAFELYVSCVAFREEDGEPLLQYSADAVMTSPELVARARKQLRERFGIAPERVYCTATHTHSGICYYIDGYSDREDPGYLTPFTDYDGRRTCCRDNLTEAEDTFVRAMLQAAEEALGDLAAVSRMQTGRTEARTLDGRYYNYVRHFPLVAKEDPSVPLGVLGPNFNRSRIAFDVNGRTVTSVIYSDAAGELPEEERCHVSRANHELELVKLEREGKLPILLCGFRAHAMVQTGDAGTAAAGVGEREHYTPDFVGPFRDYLEHELNCRAMYLQGDCGNIAPKGGIPKEQLPQIVRKDVPCYNEKGELLGLRNLPNDFGVYGRELAQLAVGALRQGRLTDCLGDGRVVALQQVKEMPFRSGGYYTEIDDRALAIAQDMVDYFKANYNTSRYELKNIWQMTNASGGQIHSYYHAANVIARRAEAPHSLPLELNAYRIGELAFALAPYEMFDTDGDRIREAGSRLQYKNTVVCGYTNDWAAYVPSELGFTQGGSQTLAEPEGSYLRADGSEVRFTAPQRTMLGCYEADQCRVAPVFGPDDQPLYGTYDGSDGVHQPGDPVYAGEYLADTLAEMLAEVKS